MEASRNANFSPQNKGIRFEDCLNGDVLDILPFVRARLVDFLMQVEQAWYLLRIFFLRRWIWQTSECAPSMQLLYTEQQLCTASTPHLSPPA